MFRLTEIVDRIIVMAAWNLRTNAHERQWGCSTIIPILQQVSMWPGRKAIQHYNM